MQARDIASIQGFGQWITKGQRVKPMRGDKIESAGSFRHGGRQSFGEVPHKPEGHFLARWDDNLGRGARRGGQQELMSASSGLVPFV